MICNGEKRALPITRGCPFFGGGGVLFWKICFSIRNWKLPKFKSEVLVKWKAPKIYKLEDLSRELFLHCDSVITAVIVPTTVFFLSSLEREQLASSIRKSAAPVLTRSGFASRQALFFSGFLFATAKVRLSLR